MIADFISYRMGWSDIWCAHAGYGGAVQWLVFSRGSRWSVGVWTGPDADLLCVKRCETNEEAEQWLSPGGPTVGSATLLSLAVYLRVLRTDSSGDISSWPIGAISGWLRRQCTARYRNEEDNG